MTEAQAQVQGSVRNKCQELEQPPVCLSCLRVSKITWMRSTDWFNEIIWLQVAIDSGIRETSRTALITILISSIHRFSPTNSDSSTFITSISTTSTSLPRALTQYWYHLHPVSTSYLHRPLSASAVSSLNHTIKNGGSLTRPLSMGCSIRFRRCF